MTISQQYMEGKSLNIINPRQYHKENNNKQLKIKVYDLLLLCKFTTTIFFHFQLISFMP